MSYSTIDSFSLPRKRPIDELTRNASSVNSDLKPRPTILTAPINKTISNYLFQPQKIPLAVDDKTYYKSSSSKPFFAKNRKLLDSKNKASKGIACPVIVVPTTFKNMLRAKSTVIKQKKLQEYYINREGRNDDLQKMERGFFDTQNSKSNLIRTNFAHKKVKRRINSLNNEKKGHNHSKGKSHKELKIFDSKIITIQSLTEDLSEAALKEKDLYGNKAQRKYESGGQGSSTKANWRNLQKRHKPVLDKQNMQFLIAPWGGTQNEDVCF